MAPKTDEELHALISGLTPEELHRLESIARELDRAKRKAIDEAFDAAHPFPKDGAPSLAKGVTYSHVTRCTCGRGMVYANHAHPKEQRGWVCDWLFFASTEEIEKLKLVEAPGNGFFGRVHESADGKKHRVLPFVSYEVKSEWQPSADGISTRPGPLRPDPKAWGELVCELCQTRFAKETDHRVILAHEARHREPVRCARCRDTGQKWIAFEENGRVVETLSGLPCDDHVGG